MTPSWYPSSARPRSPCRGPPGSPILILKNTTFQFIIVLDYNNPFLTCKLDEHGEDVVVHAVVEDDHDGFLVILLDVDHEDSPHIWLGDLLPVDYQQNHSHKGSADREGAALSVPQVEEELVKVVKAEGASLHPDLENQWTPHSL